MQITLAGNNYNIGQFILRQIMDIDIKLAGVLDDAETKSDAMAKAWDIRMEILVTALSKTYPEVTRDVLAAQNITQAEFNDAYMAVLRHGGFIKEAPVLTAEI